MVVCMLFNVDKGGVILTFTSRVRQIHKPEHAPFCLTQDSNYDHEKHEYRFFSTCIDDVHKNIVSFSRLHYNLLFFFTHFQQQF